MSYWSDRGFIKNRCIACQESTKDGFVLCSNHLGPKSRETTKEATKPAKDETKTRGTGRSIYGDITNVATTTVCANKNLYKIMTKFQLGREEFTKIDDVSKGGTSGTVFFYNCKIPEIQLAVKYFADQEEAQNEELLMNAINKKTNRCDVIPGRPFKFQYEKEYVCIVMERAETLKAGKTPEQARVIVDAVAQQVLCLSSYKWNDVVCYYTDLKPENILEKNGKVMLGDLGSMVPHFESDPMYISTHWLPKEWTGTRNNQKIAANRAKECIAYLLAMLEWQIQAKTEECIIMYMGGWWENEELLGAVLRNYNHYLGMFAGQK